MRTLALLLLVAALGAGSAPLDRYFGTLGVSSLRIHTEIFSIRDRYETHKLLPEQAEHLLLLDENAFDDWMKHYPKDDWLVFTAYDMAKVYQELSGATARDHAVALYQLVAARWGKTRYGHLSRLALKQGVAVRPDPPWAVALRATQAATPSPSPTPSPVSAQTPSAAPSGVPSPHPS